MPVLSWLPKEAYAPPAPTVTSVGLYDQTTFDEFWDSLVSSIGREHRLYDLIRNSPVYRLRIYLDERDGRQPAVQLYVEFQRRAGVRFWEFSELPARRGGTEDIRSVTARWCRDIYEKAEAALTAANMNLIPVPGIVVSVLPDFEDMVTSYPDQVGNAKGPAVPM